METQCRNPCFNDNKKPWGPKLTTQVGSIYRRMCFMVVVVQTVIKQGNATTDMELDSEMDIYV